MKDKPTVICVVNQKGGTAKTTTAENLGIGLAREGKKVLLVDTDPQGSLSISLGYPRPDDLETTLFDLLNKTINEDPIQPGEGILHQQEGVDLIPANISLAGLEVALVNTMNRERILKQFLEPVKKDYDYVLLDCMPSLGMLTVNALAAADTTLIPVQANYLSAKGLEQLLQTINKVKRQINPKLRIEGILLTMVDSRTNYAKEIVSIKEKDARIKEIEALRQHIFDYSKTRKIYLEYKRLPKAKKAEFYELHRAEIELQEAARTAFDQLPEGTKLPTVKELNAERTRLIRERQAEYAEYRKVKADRTEFIRAKQNADVILNRQKASREGKERS